MPAKRRQKWPKIKFLSSGRKLSAADLQSCAMPMTDDLCEFLRRHNGGVPEADTFLMKYEGMANTVARVRQFNGIASGERSDVNDIAETTLQSWHDLPRGSVPIGDIDIDDQDFDGCTLLTFLWGPRADKIYFFDNPHDMDPLDPDDDSRLTLLANSLPQFLKSLGHYDDYCFREIFTLPCGADSFPELEAEIEKAGADEFCGDEIGSRRRSVNRYAVWPKPDTTIYLADNAKDIYSVPLPKAAAGSCCLAVDVTKWNRTKVLAAVKKALGKLPAWKGAKSAGRSSSSTTPYWRR